MHHTGEVTNRKAHSCSTFMLEYGQSLVGHNLDDYIDVPGLVVVNKRGITKSSISWSELVSERSTTAKRLCWTSQYGSITYTARGRECIDGGMNEAGLYMGEMTLLDTQYPQDESRPKICQVLWMQYVLDTFETVPDVLTHLDEVEIDDTCRWHFFLCDRSGKAAVIEFLDQVPVVYTGSEMPVKILCNDSYRNELERLKKYQGFGGDRNLDHVDGDMRFVWGAAMLKESAESNQPPMERAIDILTRVKGESNRWGIIYDILMRRMYFRTNEASNFRYVDFSAFDLSPDTPALILDINEDLQGDVASHFESYSHSRNREYIARFWTHVDWGDEFNSNIRPILIENSSKYVESIDRETMDGWRHALKFSYVSATPELKRKYKEQSDSNASDFIDFGDDYYSLIALDVDKPIALIVAKKRPLAKPLHAEQEAYIDIIEVQPEYQRQRIGTELMKKVSTWAKENRIYQIRAWSEEIRYEALMLWHKLGYTFSQVEFQQGDEKRYGFYVTKRL